MRIIYFHYKNKCLQNTCYSCVYAVCTSVIWGGCCNKGIPHILHDSFKVRRPFKRCVWYSGRELRDTGFNTILYWHNAKLSIVSGHGLGMGVVLYTILAPLLMYKTRLGSPREYWMIYRGPGFLAVVWFGISPTPSHTTSPVSKLSLFLSLPVCRRSSLLTEKGGRGRSQIMGRRESLVLYKSFNTLWVPLRVPQSCQTNTRSDYTSRYILHSCRALKYSFLQTKLIQNFYLFFGNLPLDVRIRNISKTFSISFITSVIEKMPRGRGIRSCREQWYRQT
jgi:hypothetical protein